MLENEITEDGERCVACTIICQKHRIVHLANISLRYFLLVFKGNSDTLNDGVLSDQATSTFNETTSRLGFVSASRESSLRDRILQREGSPCVLTGVFGRSRVACTGMERNCHLRHNTTMRPLA
ncbi:hypothetical protein K439DRAFT_1617402 [Ramaria rubella]|nr:hypothetical protein K439DRAFT_1617402 [Ramaria rubella]